MFMTEVLCKTYNIYTLSNLDIRIENNTFDFQALILVTKW